MRARLGAALISFAIVAASGFAGLAARNETGVKKQVISLEGLDIVMVYIPAGDFLMGSPPDEPRRQPDEGPQRRVRIAKGFWIGETEVTQGQWKAATGDDLSSFFQETPEHPVKYMSFDEAQGLIASLNKKTGKKFRLPFRRAGRLCVRVRRVSAGDG